MHASQEAWRNNISNSFVTFLSHSEAILGCDIIEVNLSLTLIDINWLSRVRVVRSSLMGPRPRLHL